MSRPHEPHRHPSLLAFGAASLMAMTAAAAQVGSAIDNSGDYRQELKACQQGRTGEDRATCLREARNAHAEKQRGRLDTSGSLQANALARCNVFRAGDERQACEARVAGQGTSSGSVAAGGILREYAMTVPAPESSRMGAGTAPPAGAAAPEPDESQSMPDDDMPWDTEEAEPPVEQD